MRKTSPLLAVCAVILAFPAVGWSKGDTTRIKIEGDNLRSSISIEDPSILRQFNIWNGPGVNTRSSSGVAHSPAYLDPDRSAGRFIDWPMGIIAERPTGLQRYDVWFYIGNREPGTNVLGTYKITYELDPLTGHGYVYLPTGKERAENMAFISHGVEGNWFRSSKNWEELVRPLIEKAIGAFDATAEFSIAPSGRLVHAAPTDKIEQKPFAKTLYESLWKVYQCHPDTRGVIIYKGVSTTHEMLRRKLDGVLIEVRCERHRLEAAYISFYPFKNIEELEPRDLGTMEFVYGSTYYPRSYQISPKTTMKVISDHPFVKEVMEAVVRFYPGGCTKNEFRRRPWGDENYEMIEAAYSCRAVVGSDYIDLFGFSGRYFPENDFVKLSLIRTTQLVVN